MHELASSRNQCSITTPEKLRITTDNGYLVTTEIQQQEG